MDIRTFNAFKAKLWAASLFAASTCGTMALFGAVPVIARLADQQAQQAQTQPVRPPEILKASRFID
jgi:hypothetical protein